MSLPTARDPLEEIMEEFGESEAVSEPTSYNIFSAAHEGVVADLDDFRGKNDRYSPLSIVFHLVFCASSGWLVTGFPWGALVGIVLCVGSASAFKDFFGFKNRIRNAVFGYTNYIAWSLVPILVREGLLSFFPLVMAVLTYFLDGFSVLQIKRNEKNSKLGGIIKMTPAEIFEAFTQKFRAKVLRPEAEINTHISRLEGKRYELLKERDLWYAEEKKGDADPNYFNRRLEIIDSLIGEVEDAIAEANLRKEQMLQALRDFEARVAGVSCWIDRRAADERLERLKESVRGLRAETDDIFLRIAMSLRDDLIRLTRAIELTSQIYTPALSGAGSVVLREIEAASTKAGLALVSGDQAVDILDKSS